MKEALMEKDAPLNQLFKFDIEGKTITHDASLDNAIARMTKNGKTCLLIKKEDDKAIGVISEHDIVMAFARLGQEAKKAKVSQHMSIDVIAVRETDTINEALRVMAAHNVRHLPVLSAEKRQVVDFLSMMDLVTRKMAL
jgi:CBS domain-containing protein